MLSKSTWTITSYPWYSLKSDMIFKSIFCSFFIPFLSPLVHFICISLHLWPITVITERILLSCNKLPFAMVKHGPFWLTSGDLSWNETVSLLFRQQWLWFPRRTLASREGSRGSNFRGLQADSSSTGRAGNHGGNNVYIDQLSWRFMASFCCNGELVGRLSGTQHRRLLPVSRPAICSP